MFGIHHSNLGVLSLIRLKLFSACRGIWNVDKSENGHNFMKQLRDGHDFMKQLREIGVLLLFFFQFSGVATWMIIHKSNQPNEICLQIREESRKF